ncbi:hypothetical protein BS47DRAFT_1351138 [Hydnum rufescens UP504]|uniref:Uncharacterized protein n=1 Tax=Hydnum rufescens UP504 TaxID=1448309 RepID=A0A9P6DQS7_9AGAM|nr:hypothetical protein BS47DRAFT_1351138 [Hydnum rufescens UP504]
MAEAPEKSLAKKNDLNSLLLSSKVFLNVCSHRVRLIGLCEMDRCGKRRTPIFTHRRSNPNMTPTLNHFSSPEHDTADLLDPGKSSCLDQYTDPAAYGPKPEGVL